MRTFRQLCAVTVLTLILSLSAFAGEMQTPSVTAPPPSSQTSSTGEMQTPSASVAGETETPLAADADSMTAMALFLMVGTLSVF